MQPGSMHYVLKPLGWITGTWKSISAVADYTTMKTPFYYSEELSFISFGQPFFSYKCTTWNPKTKEPMHLEGGFLRVDPDGRRAALITSQSLGVVTIDEGTVENNTLSLNTASIGNMKFMKNKVEVIKLVRHYSINEKGQLEYRLSMETANTPLAEHLVVSYEKSEE